VENRLGDLRVVPDDHLAFRDGHDWDQQKDSVDVALDAVPAARLGACPAKAHSAAAVHFGLGDSLELPAFKGLRCHDCYYLPDVPRSGDLLRDHLYYTLSGILGNTHIVTIPRPYVIMHPCRPASVEPLNVTGL
jgi:hypothetical protein